MDIYVSSGFWSYLNNKWSFVIDENKRGKMLSLDCNTSLDDIRVMVCEDYGMDHTNVNVELSYLPNVVANGVVVSPIVITNDRQVQNFYGYAKKCSSISLCATFGGAVENAASMHKVPSSKGLKRKINVEQGDGYCSDYGLTSETETKEHQGRFSLLNSVKMGQLFRDKDVLQATLEICAMKFNFDYIITKSTKQKWYAHCKDNICNWTVCATSLPESTYFIITKYVAQHTCAPSKKTEFGRTASAKTIGGLIKHKYEGVKEGPKPNEIIQFMRKEHGCELSYSQAWESREYAVAVVRGIPALSFGKIPKYLHMLKEANPGTHTHYATDSDGRFKYLFLSFGQSVRGFYNVIRKVIVVDGTFLKGTYKGVLLVATAIDGNYNLYPIAFGVVDSENDDSWTWFFRQLKVVIADDNGLAFVSDRNSSIGKSLGIVYPQAVHGICIHHLLNNVVKHFKKCGVPKLVEKASKAYRIVEFEDTFNHVCRISPAVGAYLQQADVAKWARCQFPGFRFDIRTTNPAESINSALRSPREYPVIPLLDSIREMLTRWFYERRKLSAKQKDPLTIDVEKKVDRRIVKAKGFIVYPINNYRYLVKGDKYDCIVDLRMRTCTCGKYDLGKIPCRHAIPVIYSRGMEVYRFTDAMYTTAAWRKAYEESINPISAPEDEWGVPSEVEDVKMIPPETRKSAGRRKKSRYETVEDKIRSQGPKQRKCSRCGNSGHNRVTCAAAI